MTIKSWFVAAAVINIAKANSGPSFWIGKYDDIKDYSVNEYDWVTGGTEDCVIAEEQSDGFKLKRVACTETATFLCEPKPAECPAGYSFVAAVGSSSCFKLSDFAIEEQTGNEDISSILTANKMCLEDGTRIATPMTDIHRDALALFASIMDQTLFGDGLRDLSFYSGHMWFNQQSTIPASCSTCSSLASWQSGWLTPWSDSLVPAANLPIASNHTQCNAISYTLGTSGATIAWEHKKCVESKGDPAVMAMCEFRKCDGCVFPFIYAGRKYDTCVTHGTTDGSAWCSTQVDERGFHVEGSTIPCPTNCDLNDCPVGFRKHLKTCLQESSSSRNDNPISVGEAEEQCLFQGGRLYQPRSTRSLNAASVVLPKVYDGGQSLLTEAWGIHNWARDTNIPEETAIGMVYNFTEQPPILYYNDGSKVPSGLVAAKLNWKSGFPTAVNTEACVTLQQLDKLSNSDCNKYTNKTTLALSYVCEARSYITTVDGQLENPGKACVFPFKLEAGGKWHHSCLYDPLPESKWNVWCATQVDGDGVMVPDAKGNCDDERNTAYDGPDADNTCKLPFFYDGRWYENCTLYPRDDYWCATNVDPVSREMVDGKYCSKNILNKSETCLAASDWGFCPDHLFDRTEECSENYDRVDDICVRISPYRLKFQDAEDKCQSEGGHLLSIMSQAVQTKLNALLRKKESDKDFFEVNKWSTTELDGYWTGGHVSRHIIVFYS